MPPGNYNGKPAPKGPCTYCRKESCSGKNCVFTGFDGVYGNSSSSQRRNEYSSEYPNAMERSTFSTRQSSDIGTGFSTTKVSQSGSALQQSNVPFSGRSTVNPVKVFPATTSTSHLKNEVQQKNVNSNEAKVSYTAPQNKPFYTSYTSKPGQEAEAYKSNLDLENTVVKPVEPITVFKFNSTIQPISSTEFVKSNASVLPGVKIDLTAPSNPLIPKTQELPESKEMIRKCSLHSSTDCEVDQSNLEFIKTDTKRPQNADVSKEDGIKPPINKSSRCASIISKSSCDSDVVGKKSEKRLNLHHSSKASKYEGVVYQILGPRNAKVKVAERNGMPLNKSEWGSADAVHKYVLLLVDKIQDDHGSLYPGNTPINSVLSKGDIMYLICTAHNKPSIEFQLFAHQAWKTGRKIRSNNDDDSVASYGSQTGSETQESSSSKTKKTSSKNKKEELNQDSYDVSNVVNQWLDTNEYSQNRNENSKTLKLLAGCHYIGRVIEVRLPFIFIVEISSNDGNQCIFVYTNHFHPEGINSPVMVRGVSLESFVNIGDEIVVIPIKNTAMQENEFEWVASKAWPKNIQSNVSKLVAPTDRQQEQGGTVMKKVDQEEVKSLTYFKGLAPSVKHWKEFNGVILSLQYDWGLVTEVGEKQSAYVFTRENAYLFGMCLQHFFLNDVLKEGQLVKFSLDNGAIGAMNILAVWFGNQYPNFNLFDIAASKYCEERQIKFSIEELLTQHGKSMYLGQ